MSELVKRLRRDVVKDYMMSPATCLRVMTVERMEAADRIEALEAENALLKERLNSWITRGRDLMLHDPELAETMADFKRELQEDPEKARALLRSIGALKDHP